MIVLVLHHDWTHLSWSVKYIVNEWFVLFGVEWARLLHLALSVIAMEEQERIRMGKQQEKMEEEKEKEKEEGDDAPKMGFAKWVAARRKFAIDSPFFCAGNMERELLAKQVCWLSLGSRSLSLSLTPFLSSMVIVVIVVMEIFNSGI